MLLLVRTVVEAPEAGWGSPETIGAFALSLGLLAAFVAIEQRSSAPLVRLGILKNAPLVRANLSMMALFGAYVGFQFVMTLYLQALNDWSPVETALAFLPAGLLVAAGSPRLGPLVDRYGTQRIIGAGALASLVGYALILRVDVVPDYFGVFLPTILLIGIGFMLLFPTLNIQATTGVANHEQGLASGPRPDLVPDRRGHRIGDRDCRRLRARRHLDRPRTLMSAYRTALGVAIVAAAVGAAVALSGLLQERRDRLAVAAGCP